MNKAPSNIFRIDFINEIFPDCKIVHIIRDGRDNILSRLYKWFPEQMAAPKMKDHQMSDS